MKLELQHIGKELGGIPLFRDFSIGFGEGTITCILGPSGCGKTTLLNIAGKIIPPDSGTLAGFDGKVFSYIFKDPRLLPWKTVRENIAFVLRREIPAATRETLTNRFLELVELEAFAGYYPGQLSGGMRQRVAIARAFAYPSDVILMDEPLKGLDIKLKLNLVRTFARIWEGDRRTVIFVTHDVEEALLLGDEIVVLGRPPVEILTRCRVELPLTERTPGDARLAALKSRLLNSLGG